MKGDIKLQLAIVIPAYKSNYFRETLRSIANQTDKRFKVYIGDDNSPYDLRSIIEEFKDLISIEYYRFEDNIGGKDLVAQWRRCIDLTQGESYIWLFSDDDIMGATCVEEFYKTIEKNNRTEVFRFDVKVIDDKGVCLRDVKYPCVINSKELYKNKIKGIFECFVVEFIFKRVVYEREGGFVKFDLAWGSDLATWVNFGEKEGIVTIPNAWIYWRSSGSNISTDYKPKILKRKILALVDCLKWGENKYPEKEIKKINERGMISRLSQMALTFGYTLGWIGIIKYTNNYWKRIIIGGKYTAFYIVKKIRNVF